jgi:hypothetical protein
MPKEGEGIIILRAAGISRGRLQWIQRPALGELSGTFIGCIYSKQCSPSILCLCNGGEDARRCLLAPDSISVGRERSRIGSGIGKLLLGLFGI